MKRKNNLYQVVCSVPNLIQADKRARKGKRNQPGVKRHDNRRGCNILTLHNMLANGTYKTSSYHNFKVVDTKVREISSLPYWPDRIAHHAAMIPLEPIFRAHFTANTYSCIKYKGIGAADRAIVKALKDRAGTEYYLKIDVTKFYPSIKHHLLKSQLRRILKDEPLLGFLEEIIDSAPGVPIGNYLSQYFANFYLSGFDHWIKEVKHVRYYFRYADDMVIFSGDKNFLHQLRAAIEEYLDVNLELKLNDNYQVAHVHEGLDVLGYVYRHDYKLLRKRNKKKLAKAVKANKNRQSIAGHLSLAKHCNSRHLLKKLKLLPKSDDRNNTDKKIQRIQHQT